MRERSKVLDIKKKPLVSIIVPSYNQGTFIHETIESCLGQNYRPIEIIVVDGASTDGTVGILHEYDEVPEVIWISEPDKGVADAVNKGFALANGRIGGIQSSDDKYLPGAISLAVEQFQQQPELGLVYGDIIYINESGNEVKRLITESFSLENFLSTNTLILQPATFFLLDLVQSLGGWNSEYFVCDTELWLRMVFRTQVKKIDTFLGGRRLHEKQRNTQAVNIVESYCRMIDASSDIASAPKRLKQAAECGKFLIKANYNQRGSMVAPYYNCWRALFAFPDIGKSNFFFAKLIPGYWHFYRVYSLISKIFAKFKRIVGMCF